MNSSAGMVIGAIYFPEDSMGAKAKAFSVGLIIIASAPVLAQHQKQKSGAPTEETQLPANATAPVHSPRGFFLWGAGLRMAVRQAHDFSAIAGPVEASILRSSAAIYQGSGPELAHERWAFAPAFRAEWELGFSKLSWLYLLTGFEALHQPTAQVAHANGNFRYRNPQANYFELTDVTYSGSLVVTESRSEVAPLLGLSLRYSHPTLAHWRKAELHLRLAVGAIFTSSQRDYTLTLNPYYAANPGENYTVQSRITESNPLSLLPAFRVDFGCSLLLGEELRAQLSFSLWAWYGVLNREFLGSFSEIASGVRTVYRATIVRSEPELTWGLSPGIFLALVKPIWH
ncbi:MAG: hypothetical protein N2Z22_00395 [Turneriella sp.]|nr:hypothetical protein [Turneriella sp.]